MRTDPIAALLAADDPEEVLAARDRLPASPDVLAAHRVRAVLEQWVDERAVANLLLAADVAVPAPLALPAVLRGLAGRGYLAVAAAVGALRLAESGRLAEADRRRLTGELVRAAGRGEPAVAAHAACALTAVADVDALADVVSLCDSDVPSVRHNAFALALRLAGPDRLAALAAELEHEDGEGVGAALQVQVALAEVAAGGAPADRLRTFVVPRLPGLSEWRRAAS